MESVNTKSAAPLKCGEEIYFYNDKEEYVRTEPCPCVATHQIKLEAGSYPLCVEHARQTAEIGEYYEARISRL